MVDFQKANEYLRGHLYSVDWIGESTEKQQSALNTAENMILNTYTLRSNYTETDSYLHAVCEQALHLLQFSKERYRLQQEGVTSYTVDDVTVQMDQSFISPIAKGFLKGLIYRQAGDVV